MSTQSEIYFNYNQATRQANELDSIAQQLTKVSGNQLQSTLNSLSNAWKSDSATAYLRKGQKVQGDINTTAKNLRNIASTIRRIAKIVRDAELEAWRIANERKK